MDSAIKDFGEIKELVRKAYRDISSDGSLYFLNVQLGKEGKPNGPDNVGGYIDNLVMGQANIPDQLRGRFKQAQKDYQFIVEIQKANLNPRSYHSGDQLKIKQQILSRRSQWIKRGDKGIQVSLLDPHDPRDSNQINAAFGKFHERAVKNLESFMADYVFRNSHSATLFPDGTYQS